MTEKAEFLLAYLQENADRRFRCYQLARTFDMTTAEMREILVELKGRIHAEVEGKDRVYFVISELEQQRIQRKLEMSVQRERPKKSLMDRMRESISMERCRELYPNGGNFKSIS